MVQMDSIVLIVGVVAIAYLMFGLMKELDNKDHWILKLLMVLYLVSAMLLIPKSAIDATTVCETVVSNSTAVTNAIVSYEYEAFCYEVGTQTATSFLQNTQRMYYLMIGYTVVFLAVLAMFRMRDAWKAKGGRL